MPLKRGGGGYLEFFLRIKEVPGIVSKSSWEYSFTPLGIGTTKIGLPSKSRGSLVHNNRVFFIPICSVSVVEYSEVKSEMKFYIRGEKKLNKMMRIAIVVHVIH